MPVRSTASELRIGFVALLDAAPLMAARELGYFADEGLRVTLERQIGWGNVRDKLVYGHLHASHALLGMPPLSVLGLDRFPEPVTAIMALGTGGNAITFGRRLTDVGIDSAEELARHARSRREGPPVVLAHVFGCSMHHYLLRAWLEAGGVDPDRDVQFLVLPPSQMSRQMRRGILDGFCAGELWNTVTQLEGLGRIVAVTTDVLPDHPEKVLATSQRWLKRSGSVAEALVRATLRGCEFCSDMKNQQALAEILARPGYFDVSTDVILKSLTIDRWFGGPNGRPAGSIRDCSPATTFPAATHAAWLLSQMIRWKHLPPETDVLATATAAVNTGPYRRAAAAMGLQCPPDDLPPMRLKSGTYDPRAGITKKNIEVGAAKFAAARISKIPAAQGA